MDPSNNLAVLATELIADAREVTKNCANILALVSDLQIEVETPEFPANVAEYRANINELKEILGDIKVGLAEANEIQNDSNEGLTAQRNIAKVSKIFRSATYFLETSLEILHKLEIIITRERGSSSEILSDIKKDAQEMKNKLLDMQEALNSSAQRRATIEIQVNDKKISDDDEPVPAQRSVKKSAPAPPAPSKKSEPAPSRKSEPAPSRKSEPAPVASEKSEGVPARPAQPVRPASAPAPVVKKLTDENDGFSNGLKEWTFNEHDGDDEEPSCWYKFKNTFCPCFAGNQYGV